MADLPAVAAGALLAACAALALRSRARKPRPDDRPWIERIDDNGDGTVTATVVAEDGTTHRCRVSKRPTVDRP